MNRADEPAYNAIEHMRPALQTLWSGGGADDVKAIVTADLVCTTDLERIHVQLEEGAAAVQLANRVTQVFRREDREWKLVHRHASRLEAQPR